MLLGGLLLQDALNQEGDGWNLLVILTQSEDLSNEYEYQWCVCLCGYARARMRASKPCAQAYITTAGVAAAKQAAAGCKNLDERQSVKMAYA